ncbi:G1/S-specific cyclin CLN1 [Nakaseomyces bracarensis]|uniref:Biogenesis of lysosome-related organelles complex 1 subunit CNL1 n=1 Tax=Nakaseomyces bracarensis TaxID=273131 RepID=A0ABR4P0J7_9SACH
MASDDASLGIDKLSVDYDYLLYRISDRVKSIELDTTGVIKSQNQLVAGIVEELIDQNISRFRSILQGCEELEDYFALLEQIELITDSFKDRLDNAVKELSI